MIKKFLIFAVILILVLVVIFQRQLSTHLKIILFITEEFPQIPVKPLGLLSKPPTHQRIELDSVNGKIIADLFIPADGGQKSAIIVAMGIKTAEDDKPLIVKFSDTLSRLGYIVFWPRLKVLDKGQALPEEPETFVKAFQHLEKEPFVNPQKISYMGFSVGSSTAFIAASDPEIAQQVHGLVFFGGQFDIFEYLLSLATKKIILNDNIIPWEPDQDAVNHAKGLLEAKEARQVLKIFDQKTATEAAVLLSKAPEDEILGLKKYSPKERVNQFKAPIFILHDKSDTLVPYVESVKLSQAMPEDQIKGYLLIDLFEHVQPNRPINIGELAKLYGFLYKVLYVL